jgi:hypothetical protein
MVAKLWPEFIQYFTWQNSSHGKLSHKRHAVCTVANLFIINDKMEPFRTTDVTRAFIRYIITHAECEMNYPGNKMENHYANIKNQSCHLKILRLWGQ